jgi:hypothetical protein
MKIGKWVGNADFATRAILGGASGQHRGATVREVGRQARNSNTRAKKCKSTSMLALNAKGKRKLWIRDYEKATKNFCIDPRNKIVKVIA